MFPGAHDQVVYNEAGEPLGWERVPDASDFYCVECGFSHVGDCVEPQDEDDFDAEEAVPDWDDYDGLSAWDPPNEAEDE